MPRFARSDIAVAALVAAAFLFGALGFAGFSEALSNSLLFVAWSLTLLTLFMLAIRVPLRGRGSRWSAWMPSALIAVAAIAVVIAANVALYRHDVHFDVTREGRNTPPQQLTEVIDHLHVPLALTYFYNAGDAERACGPGSGSRSRRETIRFWRSAPSISTRSRDLRATSACIPTTRRCCRPATARSLVENVTDAARLGYAAMRVLRERPETICFMTGHGETVSPDAGPFSLQPRRNAAGARYAGRRRRARCRAGAARPAAARAERDRLRYARDRHGGDEQRFRPIAPSLPRSAHARHSRRAKRTCWSSICRAAVDYCC